MARILQAGATALIAGLTLHAPGARADCSETTAALGDFSVDRIPNPAVGCQVRTVFEGTGDTPYRTFDFSQRDGEFQVANSYGAGRLSRTTGFRTYFLFPRIREPGYEVLPNGNYLLRGASRLEIEVIPATGRIARASGGELEESDTISPRNGGGVTIRRFDGIRLDTGFRRGSPGFHDADGSSTFTDASGRSCEVDNSDLFSYTYFEEGGLDDARFRFATDEELRAFLSERRACRRLDLTSLSPTPEEAAAAAGAAGGATAGTAPTETAGPGQTERRDSAQSPEIRGPGSHGPGEGTVSPGQ